MPLSRRRFLQGSAVAAVSLLLPLAPKSYAAIVSQSFTPPDDQYELNDWIWIGPQGDIVIGVSQCEVGQGIYTGLAEVVAAEMDADWEKVSVKFVTGRDAYRQVAGGEDFAQFVAASTSMTKFYERTRLAGAQARVFFLQAAAAEWGIPLARCTTGRGFVIDSQTGKKLAYHELLHYAKQIPLSLSPVLKTAAEEKKQGLIGAEVARIDTPLKVDGRAIFGIDVTVPDMLIGVPWMVPCQNGKVIRIRNEAQIRALPGIVDLVITRQWSMLNMMKHDHDMSPNTVIVVAHHYWQAKKAADLLDVEFQKGPKDTFSTASIDNDNRAMLTDGDMVTATTRGDAPALIQAGKETPAYHDATYKIGYLAHATMEPCNGTCFVEDDKITAWGPFQGQDLVRVVLGAMFKRKPEDVIVHTTFLGGSFGRKYLPDPVMHAALASKATGKPVKVIYPREIDIQHEYYRPGEMGRYRAVLGDDGYPQALWARYAGQGLFSQMRPERVEKNGGWDETMVECVYNTRYEVPALKVECGDVVQPLSLSFLRGVGSVASLFCMESFINELSHKAGIDAWEYRRNLMKDTPEMVRVLDATAKAARWSEPLPANHYRGMAVNIWIGRDDAFTTYMALVIEIEVTGNTFRVTRAVCGIDCGKVVNPNLVRLNTEGGIGFALSGALHSQLHFKEGHVVEGNFDAYGMLRLDEMPEVEVVFVESDRPPQGCGETATAVVAPALAGALLKATGKAYREIPFPGKLEFEA